jgi:hypothetical protein
MVVPDRSASSAMRSRRCSSAFIAAKGRSGGAPTWGDGAWQALARRGSGATDGAPGG